MIARSPHDTCVPSVGTLLRSFPVRVLDVSRCGCRLESRRRLDPGVSGQLTIELSGGVRVDDVRVARCEQRVGAGALYQIGAELLRTRRLSRRTVRMAVEQIIGEQARSAGHPQSEPAPLATIDQREELGKAVGRAPPPSPNTWS